MPPHLPIRLPLPSASALVLVVLPLLLLLLSTRGAPPPSPSSLYDEARAAWDDQRDAPAAIALLRRAQREEPGGGDRVEVANLLGGMLYTAGRMPEALSAYARAAALAPARPDLHYNLGVLHETVNDTDAAVAAYRAAARASPPNAADDADPSGTAQIVANLGVALVRRGDVDEAVEVYRRGIARTPAASSRLHYNLAMALWQRLRREKAPSSSQGQGDREGQDEGHGTSESQPRARAQANERTPWPLLLGRPTPTPRWQPCGPSSASNRRGSKGMGGSPTSSTRSTATTTRHTSRTRRPWLSSPRSE